METKIKTYLHWKNISKSSCIILLIGIAATILFILVDIPIFLAALLGIYLGVVGMYCCVRYWTLYHSEVKKKGEINASL